MMKPKKPAKKKIMPCCLKQCCYCEVPGHQHDDGPDACPRYYKGRRNRHPSVLRPVACLGCRLIADYRKSGRADNYFEVAGELLFSNGHDIDRALAEVDAFDGAWWDTVRLNLERCRPGRDDSWGAEFRNPSPQQAAEAAAWLAICAARTARHEARSEEREQR